MYVYIFVIMIRSLESRLFIESINTHNDNISSPLLKYNTTPFSLSSQECTLPVIQPPAQN